ncbi:MAG: hemerythrin domain-containing protein [Nitrososphaerota archaeon]
MDGLRLTQQLSREHEVIRKVLESLQEMDEKSRRTRSIDTAFLKGVIDFSQHFIDACHHAKEERCLFTCLERRGIHRDGGPIGVILYEHELSRSLVRLIQDAVTRYERGEADVNEVLDRCIEYVELLRQHMYKEDNILFPMGDSVMVDEDQEEASRCSKQLESPTHERLLKLAHSLTHHES